MLPLGICDQFDFYFRFLPPQVGTRTHIGQGLGEAVLPSAEALEVVGVDRPDHRTAQVVVQDVVGLHLEALLVVVAEPLVALEAVGRDHLLLLHHIRYNLNYILSIWDQWPV